MSSLIEEGIDTVYAPKGIWEKMWHGLQTIVERILPDGKGVEDVFHPLIECSVKPEIELSFDNLPGDTKEAIMQAMKEWKIIMADCRAGKAKAILPLYVPKSSYRIHQNRELFDCMVKSAEIVCGKDGFEIVSLGTVGGYSQFFMSLLIKGHETFEVGKLTDGSKDTHHKFFNLNTSHNGLIGSNRSLSLIRQVCFNTINASIADATESNTISQIRHTKNSYESITPEIFAKDLEFWIKQSANFQALLIHAKSQKMDVEKFQAFAAGVFTNEASDELSVNSYNRIQEMTPLFQKGLGNRGNSRYDAINAFTEYFTSGNGVGNPNKVKLNKRIATANFGRGNEWKLQAVQTIIDNDLFAKTVKRGEILYGDRVKVIANAN